MRSNKPKMEMITIVFYNNWNFNDFVNYYLKVIFLITPLP